MVRVTFDSNVWRKIASPDVFKKDTDMIYYRQIRQAIEENKVLPCLAETMFTLEPIRRGDRKEFISKYRPEIKFEPQILPNGLLSVDISVGPQSHNQPTNPPVLAAHLADALAVGFRVLRCGQRIGMIQNPDIKESYFVDDIDNTTRDQRVKIATDCMREIENQGCGKNHAQKIGERYAKIGQTWFDGLGEAPSSEDKSIDDAVSEWADGDSIAAHIAYENDHFCTLDFAKKSGPSSILSPQNRAWLTSRYGVSFKTHKELAESLSD